MSSSVNPPRGTPSKLDEILDMVQWGDYQKEDGTWSRGIANRPDVKSGIKTAILEALVDAPWTDYDGSGIDKEWLREAVEGL